MQPLRLPNNKSQVKPGDTCLVAGWGKTTQFGTTVATLREVEVTVQKDKECENRFRYYNSATEMCVGDPAVKKDSFTVRLGICHSWLWGKGVCHGSGTRRPRQRGTPH